LLKIDWDESLAITLCTSLYPLAACKPRFPYLFV
jgi:hypothetical protein